MFLKWILKMNMLGKIPAGRRRKGENTMAFLVWYSHHLHHPGKILDLLKFNHHGTLEKTQFISQIKWRQFNIICLTVKCILGIFPSLYMSLPCWNCHTLPQRQNLKSMTSFLLHLCIIFFPNDWGIVASHRHRGATCKPGEKNCCIKGAVFLSKALFQS